MNDTTAEMHVLTGVLDGIMSIDEVLAYADRDCFQDSLCADVFGMMIEGAATAVTLKGVTKNPATKAFIDQLTKVCVNRSEMMFFIQKLNDLKYRRETVVRAEKAIELAKREGTKIAEIDHVMNAGIMGKHTKKEILLPTEYAPAHKAAFEERMRNPTKTVGLSLAPNDSGFERLNETFMGIRGGDCIMICAQSGHGKTALALNIARVLGVEQAHVTYYLNTEMDEEELSGRLAAQISGASFTEIYTGIIDSGTSWPTILKAYDKLADSKVVLSKIPHLTVTKAKGLASIVRQKMQGLECLIVDYIGRMEPEDARGLQEWQQLYQIIEQLKTLAVELDIPVIVLGQLTEAGMLEGAKKMKNACDGVLFFQPTGESDQEGIERAIGNGQKRSLVNYKIVKYKVRRNDNSSPIYCRFNKRTQKVVELG